MERQEFEEIFIVEYKLSSLPKLTLEQFNDVKYQLKNRYLTDSPNFEPTEQEKSWGISKIPPKNTYWVHLKNRIPKIVDILSKDPLSNKAVITIDYPDDPPCHQVFQFKVRNNGVEMTSYARSLDIDEGLPRDANIFWHAAVEIICEQLNLDIQKSRLKIVSSGAHRYINNDLLFSKSLI